MDEHLCNSVATLFQRRSAFIAYFGTSNDVRTVTPRHKERIIKRNLKVIIHAKSNRNSAIEQWPELVSEMGLLDSEHHSIAMEVRIEQPRLPTMVRKVIEIETVASILWTTSRDGVATTASP